MKRERKMTLLLWIIYLAVLSWIILMKMQFSFSDLSHFRSINLIPYGGSAIVNGRIDLDEIINNILVFVPFGIYMGMLKPEWNFIKRIFPVVGVSLAYEVLQFVFAIGACDITDLIDNTLGGVIGMLVFFLLSELLKEKTCKVLNGIALICTILAVCFIGFILGYNALN